MCGDHAVVPLLVAIAAPFHGPPWPSMALHGPPPFPPLHADPHPGADVNTLSLDSSTPLLLAIKRGQHAVARVLLTVGATDIELADDHGVTPLMAACRLADLAMVNAILACARRAPQVDVMAYIEMRSVFGVTAIMHACGHAMTKNVSCTRPWTPVALERSSPGSGSGGRDRSGSTSRSTGTVCVVHWGGGGGGGCAHCVVSTRD